MRSLRRCVPLVAVCTWLLAGSTLQAQAPHIGVMVTRHSLGLRVDRVLPGYAAYGVLRPENILYYGTAPGMSRRLVALPELRQLEQRAAYTQRTMRVYLYRGGDSYYATFDYSSVPGLGLTGTGGSTGFRPRGGLVRGRP